MKKYILLFLFLIIFTNICFSNQEAENYFEKASNYYKNKNYEKAIECLKKAIEINPDNKKAYCGIGTVYDKKGNYDKAIDYYKKAIKIKTDDVITLHHIGDSYLYKGEYDSAIDYYKKALNFSKTEDSTMVFYILTDLGDAYEINKDFDNALKCYKKAYKIKPEDALRIILSDIGNIYKEKKDYDNALKYYKKAHKLNPEYPYILYRIGQVYTIKEDYDNALKYYVKGYKINPEDHSILSGIGEVYEKIEYYDNALYYYKKAHKIKPEDFFILSDIRNIYEKKEDYDNALKYTKKALELYSDLGYLYEKINRFYFKANKVDDAINFFKNIINSDPNNIYPYLELGKIYLSYRYLLVSNHNFEDIIIAKKYYTKAYKINSENIRANKGLGLVYFQEKRYDRALKYYNNVITIDPENKNCYNYIAEIYEKKNEYHKAIDYYKKSIERNDKNTNTYSYIAEIYFKLAYYKKTIEYFQKSFENLKSSFTAFYIAFAYEKLGYEKKANIFNKKAEELRNKSDLYVSKQAGDPFYIRGDDCYENGNYNLAVDYYKKAIDLTPEYPEAYYNLGLVYYYKKHREITSADYFYNAGLLYMKKNNREKVLKTIDVMQDLVPHSPLVNLLTEKFYSNESKKETKEKISQLSGSGFIISNKGYIVTNYHVIKNSKTIEIYTIGRNIPYEADIFIKDVNNDIAILKIDNSKLEKTNDILFGFGEQSDVKIGQEVFTIGFPMENILGESAKLSNGIINSNIGILDNPTLIQISNPIQPGNSGSPLFNQKGEVVGIVVSSLSAKYFYENTDIIPQNVNFAIKVAYLRNILSMLPEGEDILNRKSKISNFKLEKQYEMIKPFIVKIKAYQ